MSSVLLCTWLQVLWTIEESTDRRFICKCADKSQYVSFLSAYHLERLRVEGMSEGLHRDSEMRAEMDSVMGRINTSRKQEENEMGRVENSSSKHFTAANFCFSDVSVSSLAS